MGLFTALIAIKLMPLRMVWLYKGYSSLTQHQCTARDGGLASVDYFAQILPHRDITCRHLSF
jgi:hypothetical protein